MGYSRAHRASATVGLMDTKMPVAARGVHQSPPPPPSCKRCASAETQAIVTMRRYTVDADPWFHCQECGHVFTTSRDDA